MSMVEVRHQTPEEKELAELWELVDELGDLSMQLQRAAREALIALGMPSGEEGDHDA